MKKIKKINITNVKNDIGFEYCPTTYAEHNNRFKSSYSPKGTIQRDSATKQHNPEDNNI